MVYGRPPKFVDDFEYVYHTSAVASTGSWGGLPMDFGYTEPEPVITRCEYCGIKALPQERLCVGCGAPL